MSANKWMSWSTDIFTEMVVKYTAKAMDLILYYCVIKGEKTTEVSTHLYLYYTLFYIMLYFTADSWTNLPWLFNFSVFQNLQLWIYFTGCFFSFHLICSEFQHSFRNDLVMGQVKWVLIQSVNTTWPLFLNMADSQMLQEKHFKPQRIENPFFND